MLRLSGCVYLGFQSQGGSREALEISSPLAVISGEVPRFHGGSLWHSTPACNGFLRFTYGVTPADVLAANMVVELLFDPLTLHTYFLAMWWNSSVPSNVPHSVTDGLPNEPGL